MYCYNIHNDHLTVLDPVSRMANVPTISSLCGDHYVHVYACHVLQSVDGLEDNVDDMVGA